MASSVAAQFPCRQYNGKGRSAGAENVAVRGTENGKRADRHGGEYGRSQGGVYYAGAASGPEPPHACPGVRRQTHRPRPPLPGSTGRPPFGARRNLCARSSSSGLFFPFRMNSAMSSPTLSHVVLLLSMPASYRLVPFEVVPSPPALLRAEPGLFILDKPEDFASFRPDAVQVAHQRGDL